jgi:CheY-like chemotaxis protein
MTELERSVLIVDDDELNRLLLEHMVRQLGLRPLSATDGESAVQACAGQRFALIMMDRRMPGLDGYQALARIREVESAAGLAPVPAILLSGDLDRPGDASPVEAGFVGALLKPFRLEDLARLVARVLGG